jgi:hypothetical protein
MLKNDQFKSNRNMHVLCRFYYSEKFVKERTDLFVKKYVSEQE